jgi:periplasmic nitrate reductase NapD
MRFEAMTYARRQFLRGEWQPPAGGPAEVASIVVLTRPERLAEAEDAIAAIAGAEIFSRDSKGKLVVVIEAVDVGAVGTRLNEIAVLPSVLSANLVFHATDTA